MNPYPFSALNHFTVPTAIFTPTPIRAVLPTDLFSLLMQIRVCHRIFSARKTPRTSAPHARGRPALPWLWNLPARAGLAGGRRRRRRRAAREGPQRRVDRPVDRDRDLARVSETYDRSVERLELQRPPLVQILRHRASKPRLHLRHKRGRLLRKPRRDGHAFRPGDGRGFLERRAHQRGRLTIRKDHTHRQPRERGHPAHAADEDELLPETEPDI